MTRRKLKQRRHINYSTLEGSSGPRCDLKHQLKIFGRSFPLISRGFQQFLSFLSPSLAGANIFSKNAFSARPLPFSLPQRGRDIRPLVIYPLNIAIRPEERFLIDQVK